MQEEKKLHTEKGRKLKKCFEEEFADYAENS